MNTLQRLKFINLTTDLWTSRTMEAYITITAYSIDKKFNTINLVIDTHHMPDRHTADNISDGLEKAERKWKVGGKVFAVVTNNASSMCKIVHNMIRNRLFAVHNNCFAHTLCVEDGLKSQRDITAVIEKFRVIVNAFHHSTVDR